MLKNKLCLFRLSSSDSGTLCGNLEEILTFQQGLCVALEECTKYVTHDINGMAEHPSLWVESYVLTSWLHPVIGH